MNCHHLSVNYLRLLGLVNNACCIMLHPKPCRFLGGLLYHPIHSCIYDSFNHSFGNCIIHGVILRCCGGPATCFFPNLGRHPHLTCALKGHPKLSFPPLLNRGTVAAAIPDEMCKNCWQKIANQYLERSPSVHS